MPAPITEFLTLGDPVLEHMLSEATRYIERVTQGNGRWLSMLGPSGTGKTFLCSIVCRRLGGTVKSWPRFMAKMRSGDFHIYDSVDVLIKKREPLMLDEIGVGNDRKDFSLDLLFSVLEGRRSAPTIITSNLSLAGLAELDSRLASRLVRNGTAIKCDTKDFALRRRG